MADPLSNFKSSQFVSQYKGVPLAEFQQAATVLQNRGIQNRDAMDKLDMMAYQVQTAPIDESVKQARIKAIRDEQERIASTGAYEMAGDLVRAQSKDFMQDKRLQTAQSNFAQYQKDLEEAAKHNPAQQVKLQLAYQDYVKSGGVGETADEFGRYNKMAPTTFYDDVDIQEKLNKIIKDFESNKKEWARKAQEMGYLESGSLESVTPERVRAAAMQMLQADPQIARQLEDEAKYLLYRQSGDLNSLRQSATTPVATRKMKDPKTGEIKDVPVSAYEYITDNYVNPFVLRESFERKGYDLKSDNMYSGYASNVTKMGDVTYMQGSAVNFGNVPDYKNYAQTIQSSEQLIASYQAELADPNVSAKRKEEVASALATEQSNYSRLSEYKKDFLKDQEPAVSFATRFYDILTAKGISSDNVSSASNAATPRGANDNATDGYSNKMAQYRQEMQNAYRQAYQETYGTEAPNTSYNYVDTYRAGQKSNKKLFSDDDFQDYIDNLHSTASTTPGIYMFPEGMNKTGGGLQNLRTAIQGGNINVYHSTETGNDVEAVNMIKNVPDLQIVGATAEAGQGSLTVVRVPTYSETDLKRISDGKVKQFIADNQGKYFYVEELGGGNNLATKVNGIMMEADKAYRTSTAVLSDGQMNPAGANNAMEFLDKTRGVANPDYFAQQIAQAETTRTPSDLFVPGQSNAVARINPVVSQGNATLFQIDIIDPTTGEVSESRPTKMTRAQVEESLQNIYNHYNGEAK